MTGATAAWLALAALAVIAPAAQAAPGGHRRAEVDADADAEATSRFWDDAVDPSAATTRARLDDAVRLLRVNTGDLVRAVDLLAAITDDAPDQAAGWGYLAIAAERLRRWPLCATAYAATWRLDPTWRPVRLIDARTSARHGLLRTLPLSIALCAGRAGDLDGAAATLAAAIARGDASPELWFRAGELAMAQGRLTDAIAALDRAIAEPGARWFLAVAYDRARRDAEAQAAAEAAQRDDPFAVRAGSAGLAPLQVGDTDYLLGFAAERGGRPEYAIAYYRRYQLTAPASSPWLPRAAAHLEALATVDLAERASIDGAGATALDRAAIIAAIRGRQPALAACMATIPTGLHELRITVAPGVEPKPMPWPARSSRPTTTTRAGRRVTPRFRLPPPPPEREVSAVSAYPLIAPLRVDDALDATEDARGCLERIGATLPRPPAATGAWRVRIPVIAR